MPNTYQWRPEQGIFNIKPYPIAFPKDQIKNREATMWRYKEALPFQDSEVYSSITLGEGLTPLVRLDHREPNILVKMDYLMPTGSFKDRGAAVLIAKAKEMGVSTVVADSSGNAGTSIAGYCARAKIGCHIYVPESTSERKLSQIKAHGAEVHKISGTREETAQAAKEAVESKGLFYASHVYNPFFYEGTKTFAFEIWEQLNFTVPDSLILPVGNGTLLLGAFIGFKNLKDAGVISKLPRIIGVQAEPCAPITRAYHCQARMEPITNIGTQAEGIAIANPARGEQVLSAIKETNGTIITAPEANIESARRELAQKGFYVEPTTAATYAAYKEHQSKVVKENEVVIMSLCGSGLKK
ncbi:threonine synthase [Pseudalkalibacillus decolorationis]|uniref:threonine synthase n=1 Tax=Pseudalkalibacillus decolorationis TaxID=163879 RepID=UPI0021472450|nr:threonine synthase [Pseudalkalibacillus decolorationis]